MRFLVALALITSPAFSHADFTPITPSKDSRIFYVSSSAGRDSNDCRSESKPCKSIRAAIGKSRAGKPDHIYLKRGDSWQEPFLPKAGRSPAEPTVIAFYGKEGPRPVVQNPGKDDNVINTGSPRSVLKNVHIIGLHIKGGLRFVFDNQNLLIEDNLIENGKISFDACCSNKPPVLKPSEITIRRNIFTGAYWNKSSTSRDKRPSNIYAASTDGLIIEENVLDHGGWHATEPGAGANMFNHNVYLQASNNGDRILVRNNIITRGSSHGVQMRAGGLAEDNFFARNTISLLLGYSDKPLKTGVKAHAMRNVITEGQSMIKGVGACAGKNLCTSALYGLHFDVNGEADWQAHGNIVSTAPIDSEWERLYKSLQNYAFRGLDDPNVVGSNNLQYGWGSSAIKGIKQMDKPARTAADYNAYLGGEESFEAFMQVVLNRPLQTWDERYTASALNNFIRAGYGIEPLKQLPKPNEPNPPASLAPPAVEPSAGQGGASRPAAPKESESPMPAPHQAEAPKPPAASVPSKSRSFVRGCPTCLPDAAL